MLVEIVKLNGTFGYARDGALKTGGVPTEAQAKTKAKGDHSCHTYGKRLQWIKGKPADSKVTEMDAEVIAHIRLGK